MSSSQTRQVARRALLAAGLLAILIGCRQTTETAESKSTRPSEVSLRVVGGKGYEEALAEYRGHVVLVDFWATWCAPCIEQFPHTVALHEKYRDRGLAVISVSLNVPDEETQVRAFLSEHGANFTNLLSQYESGVKAIEAFALPGPIPCFRVYDRKGQLHREFALDPSAEHQFTAEDIETTIAGLL